MEPNMTVQNDPALLQNQEEESNFDFRMIIDILLVYRWWFVASLMVCMSVAWVYLRYSTPIYNVSSKVLIKDKENRYRSANVALQGLAGVTTNSDGFDNELEIIRTQSMAKRVVRKLNLYTSYFNEGNLTDRELYGKYSPLTVDMSDRDIDSLKVTLKITFVQNDKSVEAHIKVGDEEEVKVLKSIPAVMPTKYGDIRVEKNLYAFGDGLTRNLTAYISPINSVALRWASKVSAQPLSKTTTIAALSVNDNIPQRSVDFLKSLVDEYNEDANIDYNVAATRTAEFIEERLGTISKELGMSESEIEEFKRTSGIVDYQSDAQLNVSQTQNYESQLFDLEMQVNLLKYLNDYVNDKKNYLQLIPSDVGLSDQALTEMFQKYNSTIHERNRLLRSASESSPMVESLTNDAEAYFSALKGSLQSAFQQYSVRARDLKSQRDKYSQRVSSSPTKERVLLDIQRQQVVKADLYVMLLQKREENLINLASSAYKAKQIEEPIVSGPVFPVSRTVYLIAFAIGFLIPLGIFFLYQFFSFRIEGKEDLAKLTRVPLLGTVPFLKTLVKTKRQIVVQENRNSVVVEVYRALRSNLPFVLKPGENVILFTSSTSGEGKTFIAANLAASIAFAGKKVVVVGLDIRKPKLAEIFDLDSEGYGISDFLSRDAKDVAFLEKTIRKTTISDNLDVITAGSIPPNPAELLERETLGAAIEYLKKKYDFVILDTAPVGLISDTLSIAKYADVCLYVVRADYTLKSDIEIVNSMSMDNRLPNINIILNGVDTTKKSYAYRRYGRYGYAYGRKSYGYSYGYGYGYGHSYGYGYGSSGYGYGYGKEGKQLEEI